MTEKKSKTSEAQKRAVKAWRERNKEKNDIIRTRSVAKHFILKKASLEDLQAMKKYIREKEKELQSLDE